LNGSVDEIRISNIVRDFTMPPILINVTQLENQPATETHYDISAEVYSSNMSTGTVSLYYDVGSGFQELAMAPMGDDVYSASIPGQSPGTTVKYYVKAVDNDGLSGTSPENAETDEVYYCFGVFSAKDMVLGLDFEEGSGTPIDGSVYENTVEMVGDPTHSSDAAVGSNSIYLDGDDYLKVDSPWLTIEELTVSFWFKGDELVENVRLLHRPHHDYWYCQNYQVKICGNSKITAGSYIWDEGRWLSNELELGVTLSVDTWYRAIYEVKKAASFDTCNYYAAFQIRDANDAILETKQVAFDGIVAQTTPPLEIGHGGDGLHFKGYIDDLKIYNYPAIGITDIPKETIGGPYVADEHTMLLLHFDDDLSNASQFSNDGIGYGELSYIDNPVEGLGKCLYLNNDSQSDSSYVTVADTSYLSLTDDWTIEGWINIFTFGETSTDWRWVPRLLNKPGEAAFYYGNYYIEMWGNSRIFKCGYNVAEPVGWWEVDSPINAMAPGEWNHITFIRDSERKLLIQMVHNQNREMTFFGTNEYDPITGDPPRVNDNPVHIGFAGGGNDSWLDGFVDEVRISNVVREFDVPPIIADVTEMENQTVEVESYEISANIYTLFSSVIQSAKICYNAGSGWQEAIMSPVGDIYTGNIPQQLLGTIIKYYLKVEDNGGLISTQPATAEIDEDYYSFGIYQPETQTLGLDFEEGTGIPADASAYGHVVTMVGEPTYSSDAVVGNHSIYLEGDSSYLSIDSPFLTSVEFAVDFWFKADTIDNYQRLIMRPSSPWWRDNYQIRIGDAGATITAGSYIPDEGRYLSNELILDTPILENTWYNAIYEFKEAPEGDSVNYYAIFELRDDSDQVLANLAVTTNSPPVQGSYPLEIGHGGDGMCFNGYFDDIKIHNYPAVGLQVSTEPDGNIPLRYELSQNYPNPFNPTTRINYTVPNSEHINLIIYDLMGRKVKTLVNKVVAPGKYTAVWNGRNETGSLAATGVYFYVLESRNFNKVRKMVLIK
ncbi:MAG: T9SS type A sorting domain-containing protein, partial [Candidatus Marinimicrobia bacterium]|nr:T9SS type A sorting domain-containing protein [Candidatus Neomarinimicrobiota bacterium]